ncbi:unnamed protein product [Cladocopium goreaui]|uniref:Type II methyltransferase M.BsuFI (M.BsuFI) (Cytosine-specific methyltransferase BsuFI) (Modification methylase BsuFI) n=1 Tax=Cladocopium goreaui TaxID=2562237 RepID=A0A9P1GGZ4_9DINO|nr:unnamed protein product [Cladocopium goreaui]
MAQHLFGPPHPLPGDLFTGVLHVMSEIDANLFSCKRLPENTPMLAEGAVLPLGRVSVYDALVNQFEDVLVISFTPETWWKQIPDMGDALSTAVVDLCAGTGSMSLGAQFMGAEPMVAVDWNHVAIAHLNANHKGTILHLDISARDAARQVHQACNQRPGTVFMGFPCQPHSVQGQRRGTADPRAEVLWHGLHIAFMIQAQAVILECTPAAGHNQDIRHGLATLAAAMGWTILTTELDLADVWPSRRHRWWALLMPSAWNQVGMTSWTLQTPFDHVGTIIPTWGHWTDEEERDLQLTQNEFNMFHDARFGSDVRHLTIEGFASTILHSYANALGPCPCGCRHQAFHELTLQKGGLRGFYVTSGSTGRPRYLHPREAGLLLGVPDSILYPHDVRTSLSLLGLLASPIQTIWIYGHLKLNHFKTTCHGPCPSVEDWLWAYLRELLAQINFDFGTSVSIPRTLEINANGEYLSLPLGPDSAAVRTLLRAERISIGWNQSCALWHADQRLRCDAILLEYLQSGLQLKSQEGDTGRVQPAEPVVIAVQHGHQLQVHLTSPGSFLFEILVEMQLPLIRKVIDMKGRILPVDLRIWHPIAVKTLDEAPWTLMPGFFRRANGSKLDEKRGLHDGQIWKSLLALLHESPVLASAALAIHPAFASALLRDWLSPTHVRQLKLDFEHSSGHIACIFEAHGHWTLLWGCWTQVGIRWFHYDGLHTNCLHDATQLATAISKVLGLDFCPPLSLSITAQVEAHTCGTVALMHLFHILNPGLMVPPQAVKIIHDWILAQPTLQGSIFAQGITELSREQFHKLKQLLQDHGVPDAKADERARFVLQKDELQTSMRKELDDYKSNQDAHMSAPNEEATEQRFAKIESTLGEIQAQQTQFTQWFNQVGQASTATENAIQTINYTLSTHQQDLQGLHHEIKNVSDNLGQTLQKTLASHQTEMTADFAARFDKLEAMFAKKHRSE